MEEKDYEKLSDTELLELYEQEKNTATMYDLKQHALKILLNSYYGATSTPYFLFYELSIAEGITLCGQMLIKKSAKATVDYVCKCVNKPYDETILCAGDTDSVIGNTILNLKYS